MDTMIIEKYITKLNWNKSRITQQKAIDKLVKMQGSHWYLVLPKRMYHKDLWENAAIVLSKKGINQIEDIIIDLFYWFQDLNWPGVDIIADLLKTIPQTFLNVYLEKAKKIASAIEDPDWSSNLDFIFSKK
ncbi:MAG: DUF5071 domain-containing protein [Bacilli bacterium]|nr:DUF5071 domain-containing protein [Bacilli bacterium]